MLEYVVHWSTVNALRAFTPLTDCNRRAGGGPTLEVLKEACKTFRVAKPLAQKVREVFGGADRGHNKTPGRDCVAAVREYVRLIAGI